MHNIYYATNLYGGDGVFPLGFLWIIRSVMIAKLMVMIIDSRGNSGLLLQFCVWGKVTKFFIVKDILQSQPIFFGCENLGACFLFLLSFNLLAEIRPLRTR